MDRLWKKTVGIVTQNQETVQCEVLTVDRLWKTTVGIVAQNQETVQCEVLT
jgi:hypothetical protein